MRHGMGEARSTHHTRMAWQCEHFELRVPHEKATRDLDRRRARFPKLSFKRLKHRAKFARPRTAHSLLAVERAEERALLLRTRAGAAQKAKQASNPSK